MPISASEYANQRLEKLLEEHNLQELFIVENKLEEDDKSMSQFYSKEQLEQKKELEAKRVKRQEEEFENVKTRLSSLFETKFQEKEKLGSVPTAEEETKLDENIFRAFEQRRKAIEDERKEVDLSSRLTNLFDPSSTNRVSKSLVKKAKDAPYGQFHWSQAYEPGNFDSLNNVNLPRSYEMAQERRKHDRAVTKRKVCEDNFEHVLDSGEETQKFLDQAAGKEYDFKPLSQAKNAMFDTILSTTSSMLREGARYGGYIFGDPQKLRDKQPDPTDLNRIWAYRDAKNKAFNKIKNYVDFVGQVKSNMVGDMKSRLQEIEERLAQNDLDVNERSYLNALKAKLSEDITKVEKEMDGVLDNLDKSVGEQNDKLDLAMQKNVNAQHEQLKWHLLCMFLMASPFAQGLMVVGPLFDYIDILGEILGPIFTHPDGFASGFAQALENFPILGDLMRLCRISDGFEFLLNEIPVVNSILGDNGVMTGLTRNDIFLNAVDSFNFDILSLPIAIGALFYSGSKVISDTIADDTSNSKYSSTMKLRKDFIDSVEKIIKSSAGSFDKDSEKLQFGTGKLIFDETKEYFKKSIIANAIEDLLKNPGGNLDKLLNFFGEAKIDGKKLSEHMDSGSDISKLFANEKFVNGLYGDGEFAKKAAILADKHCSANIDYDVLEGLQGSNLDNEAKRSNNNHAIRFFDQQCRQLGVSDFQSLSRMADLNQFGEFEKVSEIEKEIAQELSNQKVRNILNSGKKVVDDIANYPSFDPTLDGIPGEDRSEIAEISREIQGRNSNLTLAPENSLPTPPSQSLQRPGTSPRYANSPGNLRDIMNLTPPVPVLG